MTPTDIFLALVRVYSNTGVPSGSLPKSRFSILPATAVVVAMRATAPAIVPILATVRRRACHEGRSLTTDSTLYFCIANPPGSEWGHLRTTCAELFCVRTVRRGIAYDTAGFVRN